MKYSYSWLKELSGTKLSVEKVTELLTMHSFEVEGLEKIGKDLEGVVVGEILEIEKHPNADKLQLVKINIGTKKLDIICGASNIKIGDKVPVATIGTELPASSAGESHGLKIKEVEIRSVKSFGMLCAQDELGLGKNHSGIMILEKKAKIGMSLAEYLGFKDEVLEIKVLPDRAHDAMSYVGVAREISVLDSKKFNYDFDGLKLSKVKSKKLVIKVDDKKLCPRYIGAVIENIEVKDSPDWMKTRLMASGMRPINNIVDATNYVMLEIGQPLHAFDYAVIKSSDNAEIIIRRAKKDEKLILLDDSEIKLSENDLLITNGEAPLALAGIMGGKDSGISENTKTIVLEAANFDAVNIRKTRTRLGIKTEASDRFEKDIDPNLAEKACVRAIEIIEKIAGGKLEGVEDVYPNPVKPWKIKLDMGYVNKLLGEIIPAKDATKILNKLGINTSIYQHMEVKNKKEFLECVVPTFRIDLRTQEDLIEEIGRIWGYEKIKPQAIISEVKPAKMSQKMELQRKMKDALVGLGFDEVMNYSFYSREDANNCGLSEVKHLELENPSNPEQELLRISLLPNILKNARENLKNFEAFDIFEMGRVYFPDKAKKRIEKTFISGASVFEKKSEKNFFEVKGYLEAFFQKMHLENLEYISDREGMKIKSSGKEIGFLKIVSENILESFEIKRFKGNILAFEFDADLISELSGKSFVYKPISKYPKVRRDISFLLEKNKITVQEISDLIKKLGGKFLESAELFDIFQKEDKTSLAYHLEFGANERTLENKEVDEIMQKIIFGLKKELQAEIRK